MSTATESKPFFALTDAVNTNSRGITMKKAIALLIGATFAGITLAQTPAPTVPPVQTPRATTPPVEVKPSVSANTATKAEVKSDKTAGATVKTEKDAMAKTPKKPKSAKTVTTGDVKSDVKAEVKGDVKADMKKADKKP